MEPFAMTLGISQRAVRDSQVDQTIISRCKSRDAEAFGILIDHYQARVYGYVRRIVRTSEEAEDVAQEVFVRAYQNINRFDGRASVATWLFKIASNLCIDRARKRDRRPTEVSFSAEDSDGSALDAIDLTWDPQSSAVTREMEGEIERAIHTLSSKLKPVLLLHDIEGLNYDEIAQVLGIPVGTVKSRLFIARGHLQKTLTNYLYGDTE